MNFNFGDVLGRTWKIGWNHKVLWLWQMLPALTAIVFMPLIFISPLLIMSLGSVNEITSEPWVPIVLSLVAFLYIILTIFLAVIIQLITTYGAVKVEKGGEKLTFRGLFTESLPYFWRVLGLYAIFGGAWMVIWFSFMTIFIGGSMVTMGLATMCFLPLFLLAIPIFLAAFSVLELAQAAIVADDMKTLDAISHGWKLFRANWLGVTLLMLILYFGMYIISSILVLPAMFPLMMVPMGMDSPDNINSFMVVVFIIVFSLMFGLMYAVQGILMAFFQSAWAVTYLRLSNNTNTPIIVEDKPLEAGV